MVLGLLSSRALRSSSSRVLSTNTYILTTTIFSTPELRKPVALEAATDPGICKISGARFHFPKSDPKGMISRFCYHDRVSISGNCRMRLIEVEKLQRSVASTLVALLPALFLGLSLTPVLAEDASTELTETDSSGSDFTGLRKIDDGSVVSNSHTSKWRVFNDNGKDLFLQGKLEDAERLFVGALQEAKEGFGVRDLHVAIACNNLAELYKVKKAFDKAEPLYLEAINILEESCGHEDIRIGVVLNNLGQIYLDQKKLDGARACYERALKIRRRVLGEDHADYAMTMYHLGKVLQHQGNGKDAEALKTDSIRILEDGGQGGSFLCMSRLRYLVQFCIDANKLTDAVNIKRKILHMMEVSKGWDSLETVIEAESLVLILRADPVGSWMEVKELLQRCLDSRKRLLSEDDIQIAVDMLLMARVELELVLYGETRRDISKAIAVVDKAKDLLGNAIRPFMSRGSIRKQPIYPSGWGIARQNLDKLVKQGANRKSYEVSQTDTYSKHMALFILLNALYELSKWELVKTKLQDPWDKSVGAEEALLDCISAFKQYGTQMPFADIKGDYLRCLKCLSSLLSDSRSKTTYFKSNSQAVFFSFNRSRGPILEEVENEIERVEGELLTPNRKS